MKQICENCVFFKRDHRLDNNFRHYVVHACTLKNEPIFPEHGACKFYIEIPAEKDEVTK